MTTVHKCTPEDLKFSGYCYAEIVVGDGEEGFPVPTTAVCKYYQGVALLKDGICTKLKSPIIGYRKLCCCMKEGESSNDQRK